MATTTASADEAPRRVINSWLKGLYLEHDYQGDISIFVQDFINMLKTSCSASGRSWLSDDQLALPMVLQLQNKAARSDIIIVPPSAASSLASIGAGMTSKDEFTAQAPRLLAAMKEANVRWLVIPSNDGMTQLPAVETPTSKAHEKPVEGTSERRAVSEVPKQTRVTRAATARLAREVSERPKDNETRGEIPKVIKPVPATVRKAKAFRGTHWAMIVIDKENADVRLFDGYLQNRVVRKNDSNKTVICSGGKTAKAAGEILRGYEAVMEKESGLFKTGTLKHVPHAHLDSKFKGDQGSSCAPWVFAMFRYILQNPTFLTDDGGLKKTFRKSQKGRHVKGMSFNSKTVRREMQDIIAEEFKKKETADDLPYKLTPQVLHSLSLPTVDQLLESLDDLRVRNRQRRRNDPLPRRSGTESDDSDSDDDDLNPKWPKDYKDIPFSELKPYITSNPSLTIEERLQEAYQFLIAFQRSIADAQNDEVTTRNKELQESDAFKAIVNQTIAFASMTDAQVDEWTKKNAIEQFQKEGKNSWTDRMYLQRLFGGFEKLDKGAAATFRDSLKMKKSLSYMNILEEFGRRTKHVDDKIDRRGNVQWYPDYFLQQHGVLPVDTAGSKGTESSDKRKRGAADSGESDEFRTMAEADLVSYQTPERRADPRLAGLNANATSWRAFLFVTIQRGNFGEASDADCIDLWLNDTIVFTDTDRRADWTDMTNVIRSKMEAHYLVHEPKEQQPGTFRDDDIFDLSEEDNEVELEVNVDLPDAPDAPSNPSGNPAPSDTEHPAPTGSTPPASSNPHGKPSQAPEDDDGDEPSSSSSSDSSKLSSPPESLSGESSDSDSNDDKNSPSCKERKRRRDPEDDDTGDEDAPKKRTKSSHSKSSRKAGAATDLSENNADGTPPAQSGSPENQKDNDGRAPDTLANSSFDSQATVEDSIREIYIGKEMYLLNNEDTSIFLPWDETKHGWLDGATELPEFANMDTSGCYIFDTASVGQIESIKVARLRNGEIRLRMMQAYEPQMIKKLSELPKPYPKLTVQAGTFEEPESFKSDVHVGRKVARPPGAGADKDRSLLSPGGAVTIKATTKGKYGLRARPKPSKKRREGSEGA
ncbi:hypothetical protein EJ07DRAFT_176538 [Lizonia empirigonia]|nr:hypothetical protein EJ07DRAFT_176538 [Lizonia empirigonia]